MQGFLNEVMEDVMNRMNLPILSLRGVNVFPKMFLHFDAKRAISVAALDEAMNKDQILFVVAQKDASVEEVDINADIYSVGTIVKIKQIVKLPGGISRVLVEGIHRGKIILSNKANNILWERLSKLKVR